MKTHRHPGIFIGAALFGLGAVGALSETAFSRELAAEDQVEYKLILTSTAFPKEKTPFGEVRGVVTFNDLGAAGWDFAGAFGPDMSTLVFKRLRKK